MKLAPDEILDNMKDYLKTLREYEIAENQLEKLYEYVNGKENKSLINEYCRGKTHLPSFILIKHLHKKLSKLCAEDPALNILFANAVKYSKLFYLNTVTAIRESNSSENFVQQFADQSQPAGQKLIHILVNIRHRTRALIATHAKNRERRFWPLGRPDTKNPILQKAQHLICKIKVVHSMNHNMTSKFYYVAIFLTILSFWVLDTVWIDNFGHIGAFAINTSLCTTIAFLVVTNYQLYQFGKIDINGKNIVAYKYKAFFNSGSNKKMYKIFSLQHEDESGHIDDASIKSGI